MRKQIKHTYTHTLGELNENDKVEDTPFLGWPRFNIWTAIFIMVGTKSHPLLGAH